jgi:Uma2 family endonuclease
MPKSDGSYQLSFEEFEREFAGKRYEYVNGRAMPMDLDEAQGIILSCLANRIAQYVEAHFLGTTFVDVGFWLSQDPPELRGADVGFVSRKLLARSSISDDWLPLPPDLVVRMDVPGTDMADRVPLDPVLGPRLLWIVDAAALEVEVRRPDEPAQRLAAATCWRAAMCCPASCWRSMKFSRGWKTLRSLSPPTSQVILAMRID